MALSGSFGLPSLGWLFLVGGCGQGSPGPLAYVFSELSLSLSREACRVMRRTGEI